MITRRCQLVLGIAVAVALNPGDGTRAEILSADLRVNGMSCPLCVFGIEKKLLDVEGVKEVEVLLDEGRLHLRLSLGNTVAIAAFEAAVAKAGFELDGLAIEVRGTLDIEQNETWLEAHEGLRLLLLEPEGDHEQPLSPLSRERLPLDDQGWVVAPGRVDRAGDASRLVIDLPHTAAPETP